MNLLTDILFICSISLPGHWTIGDITQNLRVNVGQNEITYTAYHSSVLASIGAESPNYVWSLPPAFLGNQVILYFFIHSNWHSEQLTYQLTN